jgi:hypothetical protein
MKVIARSLRLDFNRRAEAKAMARHSG